MPCTHRSHVLDWTNSMNNAQTRNSFISAVGGLFSPSSSPAANRSSIAYSSLSQSSESLASDGSYSSSSSAPEVSNENFEFFDPAEEMPAPTSTTPNRANGSGSSSTSNQNGRAPHSQTSTDDEETTGNVMIDTVNTLQSKLAASGQKLDTKLPKIAVVGPEDSGKSSILQAFVGNGTGLVTRRPTVIQFNPIPEGEEYGVFAHVPKENDQEKKFYDFDAIRQEIEDETNRLLGPTNFSSEPISLTIYSPKVLKLTVVDLPGIVKNVVDDQDESVIATVREMVLENIRDENTIILAVCPANQPITTSDALQIAKEVDPNRERTIGVVTKLDLMDAGTNALDVLENRKLPLTRGYVGVVNRSQLDIEKKRDRAYVLANEKKFFQESCYSHLAYRMGSQYLQELLQKTLRQHIKNELPSIREDLTLRLSRLRRELKKFEETIGQSTNGENNFYLLKYVHKFVKIVNVDLMGYQDTIDAEVLSTGAYLNYILNNEAQKFLTLDVKPDEKEVAILNANMCGMRNSISVPSPSMNALCKRLVNRFKDPLEKSLNVVRDFLLESVEEKTSVMERYPSLKNEVIFRIRSNISQLTDETLYMLIAHCKAKQHIVNVAHPDFNSEECSSIAPTAGCINSWQQNLPGATPEAETNGSSSYSSSNGAPTTNGTSRRSPFTTPRRKDDLLTLLLQSECNQKRTQYVSQMISNYMQIVKKNISDLSITYNSYFLVKRFLDYLNDQLEADILCSSNRANLMKDCDEDFRKKAEMEATCTYLQEALALIEAF